MDLIELLSRAQGGNVRSAGAQFGLSEEQTRMAFEALAPVIASGLRRNVDSGDDGLVSLVQALNAGNHGRYLEEEDAVQFDNAREEGNAILGHAFGDPEVSRAVAMQAAQETGIGGDVLKKLLPVIAGMVMAGLSKSMFGGRGSSSADQGGGGLGDILGDVLGGGSRSPQAGREAQGGGLGDILGDILGGGASRAPQGGRETQGGGLGDVLGDILGGGRGQPGNQGGGLGDILNDILGGGASQAPEPDRPQPRQSEQPRRNDESLTRGRDALDDMLGRGTSRGNAADDLLNSVERRLGRR